MTTTTTNCSCERTYVSVQEGQSGKLTFTLKDENGDPVAKDAIDTLTLHLFHDSPATAAVLTGQVINGRDNQDVLDTDGVAMHATSGLVTWTVAIADVPFLLSDRFHEELHIARFRATWAGGAKAIAHEIVMTVCNIVGLDIDAS